MTREEAARKLKGYKGIIMYPTDEAEALKDAAIQALSQEPCRYWQNGKCNGNTEVCDDAVSREAALNCFTATKLKKFDFVLYAREEIKKLPSVTQKSGKWICIDDYHIGKFKCSVCQTEGFPNTVMYKPTWNYCPNCGAKMESEENE